MVNLHSGQERTYLVAGRWRIRLIEELLHLGCLRSLSDGRHKSLQVLQNTGLEVARVQALIGEHLPKLLERGEHNIAAMLVRARYGELFFAGQ